MRLATIRCAAVTLTLALAPAFAQTFKVVPVPSPMNAESSMANLSTMADETPILCWVQEDKDGAYSLLYSLFKAGKWTPSRTIAAKRDFFHLPAELPEVTAMPDGSLIAHWIETPPPAPGKDESEAEFIYVSASRDGVKWSAPSVMHKDRSYVEHGLASLVPSGPNEASILWLQALKGESAPVSLMRSVVTSAGAYVKEEILDPDVCQCCPTAVAKTNKGIIVAYRDHTAADIRDIAVMRLEGGKWSPSKIVWADNWKINACPVNAAAVASKGDKVAIAWYTAADGKARVEAAISGDNGATFGKAVVVSTGQAYGYTSVVPDDGGGATVSWLERGEGGAAVMLRQVTANGGLGPAVAVAKGDRQAFGYPRMVRAGIDTFVVYGAKVVRLTK